MVQVAQTPGFVTTRNGEMPCEGPRAFPFLLDFSIANAYLIDLTAQYQNKQFTSMQCAWVDNTLNDSPFQIIVNGTNQVIECPPFSQGFYELLLPSPPKITVQTVGGNFTVQIILLNFYIPPQVWNITPYSSGGLPQIDIPALDAIISNGALTVTTRPFSASGFTDAGGTITLGGTAQQVIPTNAALERWTISNPDTATETLYMHWGAAGHSPIPILPGGGWDESGSSIMCDGVWLSAATTGHAFTAYYK